ncbi:uncharacterized protein LOC114442512 isoform X2 [Parambassis ranga]|uniref:Uncharacterized protein LOC114442512 isoform X2 n=1 Tax=Parambassis ranga TaxID=210632 RepID=A0A6P7J6A3_9TELE|nr:BTB/POZ domain-containing protein 18 isoform X2 [Parambassis ranga]
MGKCGATRSRGLRTSSSLSCRDSNSAAGFVTLFSKQAVYSKSLSVPVHSCLLSAISPHISSSLSSKPAAPGGQSHLFEFKDLSLSTLLRIVGLVYTGEMAGEGEKEKQEAVSAAAKLGIHGLVEVTKKDCRSKTRKEVDCFEVGVQTEPQIVEVIHGSRWRREVRNGSVFLWKETQSNGGNDMQTQTEQLQINTAPPPQPTYSYETIDMDTLQSLGQKDSYAVPQIVPISLIYPPNENQACQPSSTPSASEQQSAAATGTSVTVVPVPHTSAPQSLPHFSSQMIHCAADHPNCWTSPQGAVAGEWEDAHIEQFQSNIPGFINYFLSTGQEECSRRGRAGRRRGTRVSGSRRGRTGERRARRPRARTGGMGRGAFTQTVDVQEVTVVKLHKLFLQRYGMRVPRTGQGGGAVGRKLSLKTRELLNPAKGQQRRRRSKVWEFSQSGDLLLCSEGKDGRSQHGRRLQSLMTGSTTSVPCPFPPMRDCNVHTCVSSPAIQPSPNPNLSSPATSYVSSAMSLLHTASLPPAPPPPHEDQPEHIERLLEEVMRGLNILPNSNNAARHSQRPLSPIREQQYYTNDTEAVVVDRGVGCSNSANGGAPVLQQQSEGELNQMLDHFLQSFEKHVESSNVREERETPQSSAEANQPKYKTRKNRTPHLQNTESQENAEGTSRKSRGQKKKKRTTKQYMFSLEKKKVRVRKRTLSADRKNKTVLDQIDKQLQQMPVVKLERRGLLPVERILQGHSWQSLQNKCPEKTSSSEKLSPGVSQKKEFWSRKIYPIRSRFKKAHILDSEPFLEQPPLAAKHQKKKRTPSSSEDERLPVDLELQQNQENSEEESNVQQQEESAETLRNGQKRGAELDEDTLVSKRVCLEPVTHQPTQGSCIPHPVDSASMKPEEIIDVETVFLSIVGECLQRDEQKESPVCCEIMEALDRSAAEEVESSSDEIIDVEGDNVDSETLENKGAEKDHSQATTAHCDVDIKPSVSPSLGGLSVESTRSQEEDEDIDVIGGSSPVPDPIIISWTESSETGEEDADEDVDVFEEEDRLNCSASYR